MANPAKKAGGATDRPSPPNQTLFCGNLNAQLQKADLKRALYMLFSPYGVVLDVVAMKGSRMRGTAHVVMRDIDSSTQAMRALQGFEFFGKPMRINYAKGESNTVKKLKGTFEIPKPDAPQTSNEQPTSLQAAVFGNAPAPMKAKPINAPAEPASNGPQGVKRTREEEEEDEDEEAAMDVSDSD